MKVLPADMRVAKDQAKRLHIALHRNFENLTTTLQQAQELYAKALNYSSWYEMAQRLSAPHSPKYLDGLSVEDQEASKSSIRQRLAQMLDRPEVDFFDVLLETAIGFSPKMAAKIRGTPTPWGISQTREVLAPGIEVVTTGRHGGVWLSNERRAVMAQKLGQEWLEYEWYEEDCAAQIVKAVFPVEFGYTQKAAELALMKIDPEVASLLLGLTPREYVKRREAEFMERFSKSPSAWFVVDRFFSIGGQYGHRYGYYALKGEDALEWFLNGSQVAAASGKYVTKSTRPLLGERELELGSVVPDGFEDVASNNVRTISNDGEVIERCTNNHSHQLFMSSSPTLQRLLI